MTKRLVNGGLWVVASVAAMTGVAVIVAVAAAHVAPAAEVRRLWAEGLVAVAIALSLLALFANRADERRLQVQRLRAARAEKRSAGMRSTSSAPLAIMGA